MASLPGKLLDSEHIMRRVYDETNLALRTTATLVAPGGLEVNISAADGDSVAISDGTDTLVINPDGSINANIGELVINHTEDSIAIGDGVNLFTSTNAGPKTALDVNVINYDTLGVIKNTFSEITSVANNTLSTILTKTVTTPGLLKKITVSGTNIAEYTVLLNSSIVSKKRTFYGNSLNEEFVFDEGLVVVSTDVIEVKVIHFRPDVGNFNSNLLILEN